MKSVRIGGDVIGSFEPRTSNFFLKPVTLPLGSAHDAPLLEMRTGMDLVWAARPRRELPAMPLGLAGLSELREP
jgi:hypothetical protein